MKVCRTIWNVFVIVLSGILLFWTMATRHDCFCGQRQMSVTKSTAMRNCSMQTITDQYDCQAKSKNAFQNESCCCAAEPVLYGEVRVSKTLHESGSPTPFKQKTGAALPNSNDQHTLMRMAVLHNDELKPSKIFLLKCALLS